jgi:pimeloyl-ACP methyl ester carboxylesterase
LVSFGGEGQLILLLHGLMGRARTWWEVARWLTPYGKVIGLDARGHGRGPRTGPWHTEQFVEDIADVVKSLDAGPAIVIGHSMGGLHVEDIAPDQRGKTVDNWRGYFESWPTPFQSLAHVRAFFGSTGNYFTECMEERADGYHLIADLEDLYLIAEEWGRRDYWSFVDNVKCPLLAIEGEHTAMPAGQQAESAARVPGGGRHVIVAGAGHVVHEDRPQEYRGAVEAFLSEVLGR